MIDATQLFDGTLPNTGAAITVSRASTNVLDLLAARDVGADESLGIHVLVTEAFATATSLQVAYSVCATEGGTYLKLVETPAIPIAQLIVGADIFRVALPVNQILNATAGVLAAPGRFIRLDYIIVGAAATTGKVMAWLNPRPDRNALTSYPRNYTAYVAPGLLV